MFSTQHILEPSCAMNVLLPLTAPFCDLQNPEGKKTKTCTVVIFLHKKYFRNIKKQILVFCSWRRFFFRISEGREIFCAPLVTRSKGRAASNGSSGFGGWEPFKNMAGDNFRQQQILRYFIWERYFMYIYIYSYFISSNHLIASNWAWRCKMFIFGFCEHGRRCLDFRPIPEMNSIRPPSKQ